MKLFLVLLSLSLSSCTLRMLNGARFSHGSRNASIDDRDSDDLVSPVPYGKKSIARGRKLFKSNCIKCHGSKGRGNGPEAKGLKPAVADLTKVKSINPTYIFKTISFGREEMPIWAKNLDEKQIWNLTHYILRLNKYNPKK